MDTSPDPTERQLHVNLTRNPAILQSLFEELEHPQEVASLLEVSYRDLNYWIYRTPELTRYSTFSIPKRNGQHRQIDAPNNNVKILQQKLNHVLQLIYRPKPSVHGFVNGRNVVSNAKKHIGKRWVFNVDLHDFFPSIHFGRVRGMFMGKPYHLPPRVATVLAHLCCFQGQLPQGAPTSPIISNMICAQMDSHLQTIARETLSTYSRYADDITFSSNRRTVPSEIALVTQSNEIQPGTTLTKTIERNGFSINYDKIRLTGQHRRQVVTGITVNSKINVPKKLTNQIRAMLHAWDEYGLSAAQEEWETRYDRGHRAPWRCPPRFEQVVKGKIEYVGMVKGKDSLTYLRLLDQLGDLEPSLTHNRGTPLRLLLNEYNELSANSISAQARGYAFEKLVSKLFAISNISTIDGYTRNAASEQIDQGIKFEEWYYLVECRWRTKVTTTGEMNAFYSKVTRSGHQTMGVFISINGWSSKVVGQLKENSEKRVLLLNGDDILFSLSGRMSFHEMLQAKVQALNLKSEPFISARELYSRMP